MKLLRLRADGFGPVRGEYVFDASRATLVVDQNERGKSSVLNAISAGLYGLDSDKRTHRVLTPLERWRPWDGGSYVVELELEHEGERYTIRRDFDRGTAEVWNGRGQEVTAEFRSGKDEFPVGVKLLGLDAEEFEKCAFVRQNELEQVVPGEERARRAATLHARLESVADTHGGDTNASEAMQVLEGAAKKYSSEALDSSGLMIDNAIKQLEAKRLLVETELHQLEHALTQIAGPLEDLAGLAAEEALARETLAALDTERREAAAAELRRQLEENAARLGELEALERELEALSACAHLPASAESDLRETVARYDEAQRNLDTQEARRHAEQERERTALDAELTALGAYASCTSEDADRLVALASVLRRVTEEDARLRGDLSQFGAGAESDARAAGLRAKFESLAEPEHRLLRGQSEVALAYHTEVAGLEQQRTGNTEMLRQIDAKRHGLRLPGWFMVALGLGAGVAGGVVMGIHGEMRTWVALYASSGVLILVGLALLGMGGRLGRVEREAALRGLTDAQRRLNQLRSQRAESEVDVAEMASRMGYRDAVELIREWGEYARRSEEQAPLRRTQEQLVALETERARALDEVRVLLARAGGGPPEPAHLERVASGIRHLSHLRERAAEIDKGWSWIDDERRAAEAATEGLKERALRILNAAGLTYEPSRPWSDHVVELAERVKGRVRYTLLREELVPQAEKRLLGPRAVADLELQLATVEAELGRALGSTEGRTFRTALEIESESRRHRDAIEVVQRRRSDLRLQVDETCRKYHQEMPERKAEIDRLDRALGRARRFKRAIELATTTIQSVALDTHRRWAEFLNARVAELLASVGTRVEQLRFGEDLDFSVRVWNGQQISRGKAVMQLSAGARDQLHLAVRLAISEYLSRGREALPLLFDDVFATSDDERARAGMRLLLEHFAKRHQIILVTCHRQRHEALAQLDPELYASGVQWLDARSASLARS